MLKKYNSSLRRFVSIAIWISPVLTLVMNTAKAIHAETKIDHLPDSGHRWMRALDFLLVLFVALVIFVYLIASLFYLDNRWGINPEIGVYLAIVFPYIWDVSWAIFFYVFSILLAILNRYRTRIIEAINKSG
jgi:hypothetical protein